MKKATAHRTTYGYEYRGKSIVKKVYWADRGVYYWYVGKESFITLKEAKEYIDEITQ
jgi:hypothetical protein